MRLELGNLRPVRRSGRLPLGPATDVWSWAVMMLEIVCGARSWLVGPAAPEALDRRRGHGMGRSGLAAGGTLTACHKLERKLP